MLPRTLLMLTCCAALIAMAAVEGPSSAIASSASAADRIEELEQDLDSLRENVEDLAKPVGEFDLFDQCAYTIGVTEHGRPSGAAGYLFGAAQRRPRSALAVTLDGNAPAQFNLLAFPGEEPPSIECNENAGEEDTDT